MRSGQTGQSLIETLVLVSVVGVITGGAALQIGQAGPALKGDGAMRIVLAELNSARERSITERRQMRLQFLPPNVVRIVRQEVPAGTTVLSTVSLEGGVEFGLIAGVADTPDAFGMAAPVDFGAAAAINFTSDGTLIDAGGNALNGTVFLAIPNVAHSFRAVTILGGTGRIRGYRWNGLRWVI